MNSLTVNDARCAALFVSGLQRSDATSGDAVAEAARRAVNAILDASGSNAPKAQLWPFQEPDVFKPMREYDLLRFKLGLPHGQGL